MELPIGYDNFAQVRQNDLDLVDKSLFIEEIFKNKAIQVSVITRPRRFGKTLNLSMLHHFLAAEVNGQATQGLFAGLKIAAWEGYREHQGQYPVIFMSFKDIKEDNFAAAYENFANLMGDLYSTHRYLLSSEKLYTEDKKVYEAILNREAKEASLKTSLKELTRYLYQHHNIKPWLLMDEYDTPIQAAYLHGYYDEMVSLIRGLLGSVLKTNPNLERSVITGILRVAKESLFSGLNNVQVYSLLQPEYSTHFGFTEAEVNNLLQRAQLMHCTDGVKQWYNGYRIGDTVIYNPWSIVNCITKKGNLAPYWVNTSDNHLIKQLLVQSDDGFKNEFEALLSGKTTDQFVDEQLVFGDLSQKGEAVWSLLLMAGYLKVVAQQDTSDGVLATLDIPNLEVRRMYQQLLVRWLSQGKGIKWYNHFLNSLLKGDLETFGRGLRELLERTVSYHDTGQAPEVFYHGLLLGITASLYENADYKVQSNKESGYGRYDLMIVSHDTTKPTLILELKQLEISSKKTDEERDAALEQLAMDALTQIKAQKYYAEAQQRGIKNLLGIGLAFSGKRFQLKSQVLSI